MDSTQLWTFIIGARGFIYPYPCVTTAKINHLLPFTSQLTSSIPKMDRVRSSSASGRLKKLNILNLSILWITNRVLILFSVSNQSWSIFISGRLVYVQSITLNIWRVRWSHIATSGSYIYFVTSFSFDVLAPKLTILNVCYMTFTFPFRGWNVCLPLIGRLFPLHPTLYTNVLLNYHPFFPPML